jgi:hypothetical protein
MLQKAKLTNLPVTIVDVAPVYVRSQALRDAVNLTMTNTFPFWEGIAINQAVDDLHEDLDYLMNLPESQNKPFILGETGWPSAGFIPGVGVAGPDQQRQYFQEAYCRMHVVNKWSYYWFTGIDNQWRAEQDPNNTIEANWGFFYHDRKLKEQYENYEFQCSDGVTYSFAEINFTVIPTSTPAPATPAPAATGMNAASCQAHLQCAALTGNCCPTDAGDSLGCCGTVVPPGTQSPANATTTPKPTKVASTVSPVIAMTRPSVPSTAPTFSPGGTVTLSPLSKKDPSVPTAAPVATSLVTDQPTKKPTSRTSMPMAKSVPPIPTVPASGAPASFFRPAITGILLLLVALLQRF